MPVKPQERQITSCRARGGQHARPSHKHCKPCAKHAEAPPPRARTRLNERCDGAVRIFGILRNSKRTREQLRTKNKKNRGQVEEDRVEWSNTGGAVAHLQVPGLPLMNEMNRCTHTVSRLPWFIQQYISACVHNT